MASQKTKSEITLLMTLCEACPYTKIQDSSEENVVLLLEHPHKPELSCQYSFIIGADYAGGTVVCKDGGELHTVPGPVEGALRTLVNGWCRDNQLAVPDSFQPDTHQLCTQVSVTSSEYTDLSETDFEDDYDLYDGYEMEDTIHPLIEAEIARVQHLFGRNSIESRIHAGIDEMDLFFNIDLNNFMDEHTALAWGVKLTEPLVILLHIRTASKYLNGVEPMVDVFQSPTSSKMDRRKVAIGNQLKKIFRTFVAMQWKNLSNADIERNMTPLESSNSDTDLSTACAELAKPGGLSDHMTSMGSFCRQDSLGAQMRAPDFDEEVDPQAVKKLPGLENGFLVQCLQYGLNRITSLNEFCVICDERHVIETGLIKPCVCTRELCVFAFQTLGVMADAAEAIATDGDVVDLLIAMANAAATSPRAKVIFDPFPSIINPEVPDQLALDPKNQNFNFVREILVEVVRSRESMLAGRSAGVKEELDSHHKLAFPLMQWIIATCRAHIVLLPEDRRLPSIKTNYQFLLISSPPGKEAAFQTAKAKCGSTFAFHGSNIENWHSILRKGLVNASGTKLQLHGAAYGKGIYLSPLSSVSFGYIGHHSVSSKPRPPGMKESLAGKVTLKCLALCEVVTSKELKKSGDIWVCPNSDHVCTRFFIVFDQNPNVTQQDVFDTRIAKYRDQINHAVAHINRFRKVTK